MDGFAKSVGTVLGVGTVAALGMLVWEFAVAPPHPSPTTTRRCKPKRRRAVGAAEIEARESVTEVPRSGLRELGSGCPVTSPGFHSRAGECVTAGGLSCVISPSVPATSLQVSCSDAHGFGRECASRRQPGRGAPRGVSLRGRVPPSPRCLVGWVDGSNHSLIGSPNQLGCRPSPGNGTGNSNMTEDFAASRRATTPSRAANCACWLSIIGPRFRGRLDFGGAPLTIGNSNNCRIGQEYQCSKSATRGVFGRPPRATGRLRGGPFGAPRGRFFFLRAIRRRAASSACAFVAVPVACAGSLLGVAP